MILGGDIGGTKTALGLCERHRGLLRLALGESLLAASDLAAYVQSAPDAPETRRLRKRLATIGEIHNKLN